MSNSQSQATISCILNLCTEKEYNHTPNETIYRDLLSKEDTTQIVNLITQGLCDGDITMNDKAKKKFQHDIKALRRYVVGLVNYRLRKSKVLNGNEVYVVKEPGKLKNSRDAELKSLLQVMEITTNEEHRVEIQKEIDRRQAELNVVKKVEIDVSLLPEELRKKLGL